MPWTASDAITHTKKAKTSKLKSLWAEVANDALKRCTDKGGDMDECEASAIRQANSVIAKQAQENEMDNEWTMASVAQTAIEVGLAVARETGEIENADAAKTLALLQAKWAELGEPQAPVAEIAHVEINDEQVSLVDVIAFYKSVCEATTEADRKAKTARAAKYGIKAIWGKNDTKPSEYSAIPDSSFGDPVNYAYPADAAHARAALGYFNHADARSSGGYSTSSWAKIGGRLASLISRHLTGSYSYKGGKLVKKEEKSKESDNPEPIGAVEALEALAVVEGYIAANAKAQTAQEDAVPIDEIEVDDTQTVEEPVIEYAEGEPEEREFTFDGHALTIAEDIGTISQAAPLKLHFVIIEPGFGNKKMKRYYPASMLRQEAHKFEGVKMYATDHRPAEKSVRTEVGIVLKSPVGFTPTGGIIGEAGIFDEIFASGVRARAKLGVLNSLEDSVYGEGHMRHGKVNGKEAYVVEGLKIIDSVDWVTRAGAGGRALEIVESDNGGEVMTEEIVEEVVVEEEPTVEVTETEPTEPPEDHIEAEEEVQEMMIAEAVAEVVDATSLPDAFKNALKVQEYADEGALAEAVNKATEDYKAATGSGKPFGQGQQQKQDRVEELDQSPAARLARSVKRYRETILPGAGVLS